MNLEGITLNLLTKELQNKVVNGKIYKIFMPSRNSVLFLINKDNETVPLFANLGGDSPLLYVPSRIPERPINPPSFCMLLRKHLEEGRITALKQEGLDRVLTLEIDVIGMGRQIITKKVIFELAGKNSNIIFVEDELIVDSLKHIGKAQNSYRQILPNLAYKLPPAQEGLNFLTTSPTSILETALADTDKPILQSLIASTLGIGKVTIEEVFTRADIPATTEGLSLEQKQGFLQALTKEQEEIQACFKEVSYQVYGLINKRQIMKNISLYKPFQGNALPFPSLLEALDYSTTLIPLEIPDKELLVKAVANALSKAEKKVKALAKDLEKAEKADAQKIIADTIMANIYQLHKGETSCKLLNIYDNTEMTISLSPLLSPTENAQNYYKKYNKFKRAVQEILMQQKEAASLLEYLKSLENALDLATTKAEIADIKEEMLEEGIIKNLSKKKKQQEQGKAAPTVMKLSDTITLYMGKNNKQNEYVTFKIGKPKDLWFHTKNIPGSHVILKSTEDKIPEEMLYKAAQLAARFSKGKDSSKVPVDYTERRYVKKPNGAKPGFVIYTDHKTLYVNPKEDK